MRNPVEEFQFRWVECPPEEDELKNPQVGPRKLIMEPACDDGEATGAWIWLGLGVWFCFAVGVLCGWLVRVWACGSCR